MLVASAFLLFLTTAPMAGEGSGAVVRAGMTVYSHIIRTESIIDVCRRVDVMDRTAYDDVYQKYENEIRGTILRIGFLIGEASHRAGVDAPSLFEALDALIDETLETAERMAHSNTVKFALECKILPTAIAEKAEPFEPLTKKFSNEMKIIGDGF